MKFAENRLYVDDYVKCCNCGILIYEGVDAPAVRKSGKAYCTDWCVDWADKRSARLAQESAQAAG